MRAKFISHVEMSLNHTTTARGIPFVNTTYYILERMAGWSQRLIKDSKEFADKLRATISFLRIDHPVCQHSPAVERVARAWSLTDGLAALSFIRNKLVHQDQNYVPDAVELYEAWLLMQWLVEVFVFAIIGHSGEFRDRRAYQGKRETCTVSFAGMKSGEAD
ncbi:hypothetical protein [Paracoccus aestuarii]|uniref:hypothetical protein n=1 Tax=Paracoccus aestuarii TaxID=453842 RepID=UPI0011C405C1|nr:hypothetical protein [Paracoccus aestuarii]